MVGFRVRGLGGLRLGESGIRIDWYRVYGLSALPT